MHGLYKRFLVFCAVFVGLMFAGLIFAVVGFWALLGVTERVSTRLNRGDREGV